MSVIDFKAAQKWAKIPKNFQQELIRNVYCPTCFETPIMDYTLQDDKFGVVLEGKCKKCGGDVARLV